MSPLHPAIVHFPIGLTIASVIADTAAAATGWSSLASAGAWMVLGAAAGVTVAVAAGYYDMKRDSLCEETHRLVHLHLRFGWGILIGLWILTAWRWLGAQSDAPTDIAYLILARSEEHTSELQSLMRISYAVFCLKKKKKLTHIQSLTQ